MGTMMSHLMGGVVGGITWSLLPPSIINYYYSNPTTPSSSSTVPHSISGHNSPQITWPPSTGGFPDGPYDMIVGEDIALLVGLGEADDIDELDIFRSFALMFGGGCIGWVQIKRDPTGNKSCGCAMICLLGRARKAMNQKHLIKGRLLTALPTAPGGCLGGPTLEHSKIFPTGENEDKPYSTRSVPLCTGDHTIYVAGFSCLIDLDGVDEDAIGGYFAKYGHVDSVDLPRYAKNLDDRSTSCRWALVRFADRASVDRAVLERPHYVNGYHVVVHPTDGRLRKEMVAKFKMGDDRKHKLPVAHSSTEAEI